MTLDMIHTVPEPVRRYLDNALDVCPDARQLFKESNERGALAKLEEEKKLLEERATTLDAEAARLTQSAAELRVTAETVTHGVTVLSMLMPDKPQFALNDDR
jgi:hypothetical protein